MPVCGRVKGLKPEPVDYKNSVLLSIKRSEIYVTYKEERDHDTNTISVLFKVFTYLIHNSVDSIISYLIYDWYIMYCFRNFLEKAYEKSKPYVERFIHWFSKAWTTLNKSLIRTEITRVWIVVLYSLYSRCTAHVLCCVSYDLEWHPLNPVIPEFYIAVLVNEYRAFL